MLKFIVGGIVMVDATKEMILHCGKIKGCTSKNNFWLAILGTLFIEIILFFISHLITSDFLHTIIVIIQVVLGISLLTLQCRRLHDTNRSEIFLSFIFIPFGLIALIVYYCEDSVFEDNKYRE